ncbi:MAG TPA: histidine phosphatase family protein [Alphaproteobacteria bacterium]|nr:histidine phosphatase family protein [Alphaproteobacteria bacterium]
MAKLILFRHAKAAPASPGQSDFDRPLTDRGRRDAGRMGAALGGLSIDLALVSAARRTRETFDLARAEMKSAPSAEVTRDLYLCGARKLIRRLTETPAGIETLLVVGHNPDLHEVALWLAGKDEQKEATALRAKFPTAAVAVFSLELGSWTDLDPGSARLKCFATSADLKD